MTSKFNVGDRVRYAMTSLFTGDLGVGTIFEIDHWDDEGGFEYTDYQVRFDNYEYIDADQDNPELYEDWHLMYEQDLVLHEEIVPYDPTQQGDTDDDV